MSPFATTKPAPLDYDLTTQKNVSPPVSWVQSRMQIGNSVDSQSQASAASYTRSSEVILLTPASSTDPTVFSTLTTTACGCAVLTRNSQWVTSLRALHLGLTETAVPRDERAWDEDDRSLSSNLFAVRPPSRKERRVLSLVEDLWVFN